MKPKSVVACPPQPGGLAGGPGSPEPPAAAGLSGTVLTLPGCPPRTVQGPGRREDSVRPAALPCASRTRLPARAPPAPQAQRGPERRATSEEPGVPTHICSPAVSSVYFLLTCTFVSWSSAHFSRGHFLVVTDPGLMQQFQTQRSSGFRGHCGWKRPKDTLSRTSVSSEHEGLSKPPP